MIADALDGKIDLILTKSISRFARNTVDSLTAIRKLKEKGVEVYFEKENIHTMDAKGELMITIMSSLAQEESRSISENVRWGKRKSMADGKFSLAYSRFLGYEKGGDGTLRIVEEEAEIIRKIYSLYLSGQTVRTIADYLTGQGVPTPSGKKQWSVSTIMSILQNEKYKGDALLQKTYTADFLTKKVKKNHGEIQQYYVENSHRPLLTRTPLRWYRTRLRKDAAPAAKCTGAACLPLNSSVWTAAAATAGRCCNPTPSTGTTSGGAIRSTKAIPSVPPSLREDEIRSALSQPSTNCLGTRNSTSPGLRSSCPS